MAYAYHPVDGDAASYPVPTPFDSVSVADSARVITPQLGASSGSFVLGGQTYDVQVDDDNLVTISTQEGETALLIAPEQATQWVTVVQLPGGNLIVVSFGDGAESTNVAYTVLDPDLNVVQESSIFIVPQFISQVTVTAAGDVLFQTPEEQWEAVLSTGPRSSDATVTLEEDTTVHFTADDFPVSIGFTAASVTLDTLPASGTLALDGVPVTAGQNIDIANISALTWTPAADASGEGLASLTFTVTTTEDAAVTATSTIAFDVTPVPDLPTASPTTVSIEEDASYTFNTEDIGFASTDGSALASVTIIALPEAGGLTLGGADVAVGAIIDAELIGQLVWTPPADANGSALASLTYTVTDSAGETSASPTVITFDVTPSPDAPTAADSTTSALANTPLVLTAEDFGFSDADGDSFAAVVITALPEVGTLTLGGEAVETGAEIAVEDLSTLVWTPPVDTEGEALSSLLFEVIDSTGAVSAFSYSLTFDVLPDRPIATGAILGTDEDVVYDFTSADFGFSDLDGDTLASVTITALPGRGTLRLGGVAVTAGQTIDVEDIGTLAWTPPVNANGEGLTAFTYTLTDSDGETSAPATLTFNVVAVADAPVVVNDTATMTELARPAIAVLANDRDPDVAGLSLDSAEIASGNGQVTVNEDGTLAVRYTGAHLGAGNSTTLVVSYVASNASDTATGQLTVRVNGVYAPGDAIIGTRDADRLTGTGLGETLSGLAGNDRLSGLGGNDRLVGGAGIDLLTGGAGADRFVFGPGDSSARVANADTITDFGFGADRIDISAIDANSRAGGNQAFHFVRGVGFDGQAGALRVERDGRETYVYGDTDGDRKADFSLHLDGAHKLVADDFIL